MNSAFTETRALDNTVTQAALMHIRDKNNLICNPEFCTYDSYVHFERFVETFVYSLNPVALLPESESGYDESDRFTRLWYDTCGPDYIQKLHEASVSSESEMERTILIDAFLKSTYFQSDRWAKWIGFQWSPKVVQGFKARVEGWPEKLSESREMINRIVSSNNNSKVLLEFFSKKILDQLHSLEKLDKEYTKLAGDKLEWLAIAYAFDWFVRGARYRVADRPFALKTHILRDYALKHVCTSEQGNLFEGGLPNWGRMLDECLTLELINRDTIEITERLIIIRDTIQKFLKETPNSTDGFAALTHRDIRDELVFDVVKKNGIPAQYRKRWTEFIMSFPESMVAGGIVGQLSNLVTPIGGLILGSGVGYILSDKSRTQPVDHVEFTLIDEFFGRNVTYFLYEIPGYSSPSHDN